MLTGVHQKFVKKGVRMRENYLEDDPHIDRQMKKSLAHFNAKHIAKSTSIEERTTF